MRSRPGSPGCPVLAIGFVLPRSCSPEIVMVEPAEHWQRYDVARIHAHHPRRRNRDPLTDALVGYLSSRSQMMN